MQYVICGNNRVYRRWLQSEGLDKLHKQTVPTLGEDGTKGAIRMGVDRREMVRRLEVATVLHWGMPDGNVIYLAGWEEAPIVKALGINPDLHTTFRAILRARDAQEPARQQQRRDYYRGPKKKLKVAKKPPRHKAI